jgi:hypothetical protein
LRRRRGWSGFVHGRFLLIEEFQIRIVIGLRFLVGFKDETLFSYFESIHYRKLRVLNFYQGAVGRVLVSSPGSLQAASTRFLFVFIFILCTHVKTLPVLVGRSSALYYYLPLVPSMLTHYYL